MKLCLLRSKGNSSEDHIAQQIGFLDAGGAPSARVMYERLQEWGLPAWVVYPDGIGGRIKTTKEYKARDTENAKERKARATGGAKELPPAGRAVGVFQKDLERLTYYVEELPDLKEQLQAGRFVSSSWVGEDYEYYRKSEFSEEEWTTLCESHNLDPAIEQFRVSIDPIVPRGASPTPWEGLVPLIAMHAIMYETVNNLIDALHPDPSSVDREDLHKKRGYVDTLRTYAVRLAKAVRGGKVREGHHPGEVSRLDHFVAWSLITPLAEKSYTDEQIHASIEKEFSLGELYTIDDITRLRRLRLPPPDRQPPNDSH